MQFGNGGWKWSVSDEDRRSWIVQIHDQGWNGIIRCACDVFNECQLESDEERCSRREGENYWLWDIKCSRIVVDWNRSLLWSCQKVSIGRKEKNERSL